MGTLFHTFLVLHICGFASIAGALLADISIQKRAGKHLYTDREKALTMLEGASGIPRIIAFGGLLAILSGIGMMAVLHGAPGKFIWFRIKFPMVILLLLNAIFVARPNGNKQLKLLRQGNEAMAIEVKKVKGRIRWYHIMQVMILLTIFTLSAFKF